jgi:hypothetical protein
MKRTCNKCGIEQDLETCFYKTGRKSDKDKNNRHYECKTCTKARVNAAAAASPNAQRARDYKRKYGITIDEYEQMLELQGGTCALCPKTSPGGRHAQQHWCVDHDHVTGKVRELLCNDCNMVLGIIKDSPEHLGRMITYILKHSQQ